MRNLIPLIFIIVIVNTASAQDSLKKDDSLRSRPSFREILNPRLLERRHLKADSAYAVNHPEQKHPVIYIDGGLGASWAGAMGILGDYSVNYQTGRSLFTFRGSIVSPVDFNFNFFGGPFTPYISNRNLGQLAFMYGRRFTNHQNLAISFSTGVSLDHYYYDYNVYTQPVKRVNFYSAGIPFEINCQFYRKWFGPSVGLKFLGDIGQHGYAGFAVDLGLGWHNQAK